MCLGTNNSWSEANRDEKALGFVPEAGLVMVPFSSYEQEGNRTGVQLVELVGNELVVRGVIEHDVTPRRATLHKDRILSLSGKSLITVDASDFDQPEVVSDFPLSWAVDRIFVEGDFLIEVTQGNTWTDEAPALRVAAQADPYEPLAEVELETPNVVGATIKDGRLYVIQAENFNDGPFIEPLLDDAVEPERLLQQREISRGPRFLDVRSEKRQSGNLQPSRRCGFRESKSRVVRAVRHAPPQNGAEGP